MDNVGEFVHKYFAEVVTFVGLVIWSIRLEGKVKNVEKVQEIQAKQIEELNQRLTNFDSKILLKLSEIAERLSFIEGTLRKGKDD